MFDFLYEMIAGRHGELPRHRHADPMFDGELGAFRVPDEPLIDDGWLGRGEVPGQAPAGEQLAEGQTVADEVRALVSAPVPPTRP